GAAGGPRAGRVAPAAAEPSPWASKTSRTPWLTVTAPVKEGLAVRSCRNEAPVLVRAPLPLTAPRKSAGLSVRIVVAPARVTVPVSEAPPTPWTARAPCPSAPVPLRVRLLGTPLEKFRLPPNSSRVAPLLTVAPTAPAAG